MIIRKWRYKNRGGLDENENGVLDDDEVDNSNYLYHNGVDGKMIKLRNFGRFVHVELKTLRI